MFRSARWWSDKNRTKVVFKLQFHVTQVPQLNADGLTLSLVPGDVGKPTARLVKAAVRDGCCRWGTPVYETVKFVQDPRTGKVNEKIYILVVSTTGSTKAAFRGEASIDFAEYADAIKTSNISLPLKNSNSKALLHVSIQRQPENADQQRQVDESCRPEEKSTGHNLESHLKNDDADVSNKCDKQEDGPYGEAARSAELRRGVSIKSDSTISSSEGVSGINSPREAGNRRDNIRQNHHNLAKSLNRPTLLLQSTENIYEQPRVFESEWSGSSDHGITTDDSTNSLNEAIPTDISRNSSDVEIHKLKAELVALTRQADLSELELQGLRKQIVKESKRGQDLLRELSSLKHERDSLKAECERLKASERRTDEATPRNRSQYEVGDPWVLLEEIQKDLDYEKDLNSNLQLQLQKTQESNSKLILSVKGLEAMLKHRNKEIADLSTKPRTCENTKVLRRRHSVDEMDEDEDQKALKELVKGHKDAKETHLQEQKIMDLYNEIEIYKRDKDELETQMEQLALDYEILKQENYDILYRLKQSQVQEQLKMQYECSSSLVNVHELENQVESQETELRKRSEEFYESLLRKKELEMQIKGLEEELEKQALMFEVDIEAVTCAKVEQEQRAIRAEEALRKTRWKNAIVAEKIQKELKRLCAQMVSTFDANEKKAMRVMTEANELCMQKLQLEEMLKNANDELKITRVEYEAKLHELSEMLNLKTTQINRMIKDLDEKSMLLENQKRHEALIERAGEAENLRLELEEVGKSTKEGETLVQRESIERNELSSTIALRKKEYESPVEELQDMKHTKDKKEAALTLSESELETIKVQCDDEVETKNDELMKQTAQLKGELQKKEETVTNLEKKLKDGRASAVNYGATPVTHASNEESALEEPSNLFIVKERDMKSGGMSDLLAELSLTQRTQQDNGDGTEGGAGEIFRNKFEICRS